MTTPVQEIVSVLIDNLEKLTSHSYIAKSQSSYLRQLKDNISANTVILLLDFAKNFAFTMRSTLIRPHSLHPVCVYHYDCVNDHLQCHSFCIISDDMDHDVSLVHQIQKECIEHVKKKIQGFTKIVYFSDGRAAQYKNRKNGYH